MQPYLPQVRADRLIAGSRLALSIFALLAVRLDPELLRTHSEYTTLVLAVYSAYAVALVITSFTPVMASGTARLVSLLIDFGAYSVIVAVSRGAASPFFAFFVFSLLCAALRFGVRGTVLMAFAAAAVYLLLGIWQHTLERDPGFLILRLVYIAIIGMLLTYFAAYQERTADELQRIAAWPRTAWPQIEDVLRQSLDAAAALIAAPQIVVAFEDAEEPWTTVAELRDGTFRVRRAEPGFHPAFHQPYVMTAAVHGAMTSGQISYAGAHPWSADDNAVAEITGRLVGAQLDQFVLQDTMRRNAVGEERLRVGRDLHDGLLQSLTGIALQLQTIVQQTDDPELARRLRVVQEIIENDQHDLRAFVMQLRPDRAVSDVPLGTRLRALGHRIAAQWRIAVEVVVTPDAPALPSAVSSEVYALVAEALANAAKHAGASRVSARVTFDGSEVEIDVEDNGRGFPFSGTYDLAQLDAEKRGPVTLKERISSLGGDLRLSTSARGSKLAMRIEV